MVRVVLENQTVADFKDDEKMYLLCYRYGVWTRLKRCGNEALILIQSAISAIGDSPGVAYILLPGVPIPQKIQSVQME